jgi:hypothetical protein
VGNHGQKASVHFECMQSTQADSISKGFILLDPPFEPVQPFGIPYHPKYRAMARNFIPGSRPLIDRRRSYLESLCNHYFLDFSNSDIGIPNPSEMLGRLFSLTNSEWAVTCTYIQREINIIEWRLENEGEMTLEMLSSFLGQLDQQRRRIIKYKSLVQEQQRFWVAQKSGKTMFGSASSPKIASDAAIAMSVLEDCAEIHRIANYVVSRINQSINIITSRMTVEGMKLAIKQNESLKLLALVATVFLPFTTVASILAIPDEYAIGKKNFWVYWAITCGLLVTITIMYLARRVWIRSRNEGV